MEANPFLDRAHTPTPSELERALGRKAALWSAAVRAVEEQCGPLEEQWTHSGKAYGWSLRLRRGKRAVLYLLPRTGGFLAAFALGEKACAAAREAKLPEPIVAAIEAAPRYAEGRAIHFAVGSKRDIASIRSLAAIKLAN